MKKLILSLLAAGALMLGGVAHAAPVTPISGGGTGTSTLPGKGSAVGSNGVTFCYLPSSTVGYVLAQSSTAPCGLAWVAQTGGSGGSSTLIFAGNSISVVASGTNGYIIGNQGVTSTAGDWQGTWQLFNPSDFLTGSGASGDCAQWGNSNVLGDAGGQCLTGSGSSPSVAYFTSNSAVGADANFTYNSNNGTLTVNHIIDATNTYYAQAAGGVTGNCAQFLTSSTVTSSGNPCGTSSGGAGPSTSTYVGVFSASTTVLGYSAFTYNPATGQLKHLGLSTDNPGSSNTTGGNNNLTVTTDTEALVLWDGGVAHQNTNLLYVNCTGGGAQGCMTVSGSATSSSPLNVKSPALNKSGVKVDITSTSSANANAAAFGADLSVNGSSSAQGIRIFCTNYCDGDSFGAYGPSAALRWKVASTGVPTFVGVTNGLHVADSNGTVSAFSGSNCSAGAAPTTISATGTFTGCTTYLTGNQTITITGAVTGSGATTIATTLTTSTLYALFSATGCLTFNTSTGQLSGTCGTGTVATSGVLTANTIPKATSGNTLANSILSEQAGGIAQNGTQVTDGGANVVTNVIQTNSTNVVQAASLVWGGTTGNVGIYNTTTTIASSSFCGVNYGVAENTTSGISITFPGLASILQATCAGTFPSQSFTMFANNSTNTVSFIAGASETIYYSPGTPSVMYPGTIYTQNGGYATTTNGQLAFQFEFTQYQTSTPLIVQSSSVSIQALNVTTTAQINGTTTIGTGSVQQFLVNPSTTKSYVEAGSSTVAATIGGTIAFSATSTGNGAGASTSLETLNIPTSTFLTVGDEVDAYFGGTFASTAATNKQVQVLVASTTVFDTGAAFAPANTACNWFLEERGMLTTATTTLWVAQWTDSCQNALTDDSGDAGNKLVTVTSTGPIQITLYGNGTNANDTVANYGRYMYAPF